MGPLLCPFSGRPASVSQCDKPSANSNHKLGWPTSCQVMPKVLFKVKTSCDVTMPVVFLGSAWPKNIASLDGCFQLIFPCSSPVWRQGESSAYTVLYNATKGLTEKRALRSSIFPMRYRENVGFETDSLTIAMFLASHGKHRILQGVQQHRGSLRIRSVADPLGFRVLQSRPLSLGHHINLASACDGAIGS